MRRAAIYARFSTDLQSERSIEDQLVLGRSYAAREGLEIVAVFEDRARSGASILGRDGLAALLDRARDRAFEVIVVEALDRLSRDMEDLAGLHKRLTFLNVEIRAVHEGVASTVLVGLRGLVGQLYREDNAHKIRRGQAGRIRDGLASGGLTYGYAPVPGEPGRRTIVADEADVVRRIFAAYAAGNSPRQIAHDLNRDGIAPPRGRRWNASTINGNAQRGSGILTNELYGGRLIGNKVRMVKDPDSGRRLSRPNPQSAWQRVDVPDLAIVDHDLLEAVRARKAARSGVRPENQRRARYLLSGLLRCGCCGGGVSSNGRDRAGRMRVRCSSAKESGTCADPRTFYLDEIERAVLSGLRAELRAPAVLAEFVREYHVERQRLASRCNADRDRIERRLGEVVREADRVLDMLVRGIGDQDRLGQRSKDLAAEEAALRVSLAAAPPAPRVIALHPTALARYEEILSRLQEALSAGLMAGDGEGANALRDLVDTVVVRPLIERRGVEVEISGRLNALLGDQAYPNGVRSVWGSVVAGEGLEPPTRGL